MENEQLIQKIKIANANYRAGDAIISDVEYDAMIDKLEQNLPETDSLSVLNQLHEVAGKYEHPYIMGSLSKLKAEEPEAVHKFLATHVKSNILFIAAKIDGVSCRLHYVDGKLKAGYTRGDGTSGQLIGTKIFDVARKLNQLPVQLSCNIRGELVIYDEDFVGIADQFKNPRNACAGIVNQKNPDANLVKRISFVAYEIMGSTLTREQQFTKLKSLGFATPYWFNYATNFAEQSARTINVLTDAARQDFGYATDGLVINDSNYMTEAVYRPTAQMAFKLNELRTTTDIIGVEWRGPSKDGKFIPVAEVEPVELGGSTIRFVACHNLDYIVNNFHDKLRIGSTVELTKSGDIIPKFTRLITNDNAVGDITPLTKCTVCGSTLRVVSCDVVCTNQNCRAKESIAVYNFIRKLGIEYAGKKSLENWGINTFEDLLSFKPTTTSVSENKFYDQLATRMFNVSRTVLFSNLNFTGLGSKTVLSMIDFYGFDELKAGDVSKGFPANVGPTTIENFNLTASRNYDVIDAIVADSRYSFKDVAEASTKSIVGSVCFTGKLDGMQRSAAEKIAIDNGWEIAGVNAKLTVLVCNDIHSTSGKMKKAKSLGVKIMTQQEFFNVV